LGFTGEVSTAVKGMDLQLEGALGQVGVSVNGVMEVDASFKAALDFDIALDWSNGFAAKLDLRELSFDGSLSAQDVILNANLGPLGLSIGRPDDPTVGGVAGTKWQRGSLDAKLSGDISFVKGALKIDAPSEKNYFPVVLPIYATIAGIDLAADPATAPSVTISAKPLEGQFNVQAKNLEQLANFSKISVADLITALPNMLSYLQTIDVDQLGLSGLPFVEQSVGDLLDVASVFKTEVIDRISFDRPMAIWEAGAGESARASSDLAAPEGSEFGLVAADGFNWGHGGAPGAGFPPILPGSGAGRKNRA
jgi:hypothetical protein